MYVVGTLVCLSVVIFEESWLYYSEKKIFFFLFDKMLTDSCVETHVITSVSACQVRCIVLFLPEFFLSRKPVVPNKFWSRRVDGRESRILVLLRLTRFGLFNTAWSASV